MVFIRIRIRPMRKKLDTDLTIKENQIQTSKTFCIQYPVLKYPYFSLPKSGLRIRIKLSVITDPHLIHAEAKHTNFSNFVTSASAPIMKIRFAAQESGSGLRLTGSGSNLMKSQTLSISVDIY